RATWKPEPSVSVTSVGISSSIFGMKRAMNSARACGERLPKIGPRKSPTKRSIAVQAPPPATWQKFRPQVQSEAIEPMSRPTAAATNGSPESGMIDAGGIALARACAGRPVATSVVTVAIGRSGPYHGRRLLSSLLPESFERQLGDRVTKRLKSPRATRFRGSGIEVVVERDAVTGGTGAPAPRSRRRARRPAPAAGARRGRLPRRALP